MRRLLSTTAIVVGALWFGAPVTHAAVLDFACGPVSVMGGSGCSNGGLDQKVFLDNNSKGEFTVTGEVGAQKSTVPFQAVSAGGMMIQVLLDAGGGWSNITPDNKKGYFNGLNITIPGYEFTGLIWSSQLTPVTGQTTDTFTADGLSGAVDDGTQTLSDTANDDKEFGLFADSGTLFSEVDLRAAGGFDEIKQIVVEGLCKINSDGVCASVVVPTPEPASLGILGVGLFTLGLARRRRASS